mgnify:CR=1 FL=1
MMTDGVFDHGNIETQFHKMHVIEVMLLGAQRQRIDHQSEMDTPGVSVFQLRHGAASQNHEISSAILASHVRLTSFFKCLV